MNNSLIAQNFRDDCHYWLNKTFGPGPKLAKTPFSLQGLNDGKNQNNYAERRRDTFDHMQYVKWGSFPFAVISHPYNPKEKIIEDMRKLQHTYPNIVALFINEESWWNDGCTPYIVTLRDHANLTSMTYCVTRSGSVNRRAPYPI